MVSHLATRYGVLTDTHVHTLIVQDDRKKVQRYPLTGIPGHIGDVCTLANELDISHLWIMPGTALDTSINQSFTSPRDEWDVFTKYSEYQPESESVPTDTARPMFSRIWRKNTSGRAGRQVLIACPPYGYEAKSWGWEQITTPHELLGTLDYLDTALNIPVQWGPGHMSTLLVRSLNNSKERLPWIQECSIDLKALPFNVSARDLIWKAGALPEGSEGQYLHLFDKNSSYLAAYTGVAVGEGDPVHRSGDEIQNTQLPGIYRVTYQVNDSIFDGEQLPLVINTDWVTPDIITYARTLGYSVTVHECYQWEKKHRTLESWAYALWKARAALHPTYGNHQTYHNEHCRNNAYNTIKTIALIGAGKFASKKTSHFLRADWWALGVGRARATMFRKISQLYQELHRPVFIYNDGMYIVSSNPNPEQAIPGMCDKWDKLGGYKHEYTLRIDADMCEQFRTLSPVKLITYLHERADYDTDMGE